MESQESQLRQEYAVLKQKLEDPAIYSSKEYPALARRQAELEKVLALFDERKNLQNELKDTKEMLGGVTRTWQFWRLMKKPRWKPR